MATGTDSNHHHKQRNIEIARQIILMLENIRYGSVEIVIHDSKVVQIERKEKLRPDALDK
ncbi:MAG: YezD family protein [Methylovulum sp.]|uniref:YezD family protein n=1 Tax=Methylovulum sp. TaxID=1916980 RepID=UPI00262127C3|nr:YezD family protein [Methylovulum sp.]MDD2725411.1 YezD family protein [Methylovulum sp.]MDD5126117.1 YezD family protein [Methylovulum sp.]